MGEATYPDTIAGILASEGFTGSPGELISLLQYYQKKYGYISTEGVQQISRFLKVSETHIYGVASFYAQFRFKKPGENSVRVCQGTACHVQGGQQLSDEIQKLLGIQPGETTPDQKHDFNEVACLGCCALAPVVEVNGKIHGKMSRENLREVINHAEL